MESRYVVLAFYAFEPIEDARAEVSAHKAFLQSLDVTSRIYISEQGINAQMSASPEAAEVYMEWLRNRAPFQNVEFKLQFHHEHAFPRLTVKYRRQLVAIDCEVDLSLRGKHISPHEWKEMLEQPEPRLLLDVRNDYECKVGHFEGADLPPCSQFREFTAYIKGLKERYNPETTPVMMYCTGGIRCEVFSSLMLQEGFQTIYQLQGGVIKYAEQVGSDHWLGKLFVFDDRLTVPLDASKAAPVIGTCHHCGTSCESYYNCASMDCNELFLCCPDCLTHHHGCCCVSCESAPRLRPVSQQNAHKPFRKWYHYSKEKPKKPFVCDGLSEASARALGPKRPSDQA